MSSPTEFAKFTLLLIGAAFGFLLISPRVCRIVIRLLETHERALRAFFAVYRAEAAMDRAARKSTTVEMPEMWATKRESR